MKEYPRLGAALVLAALLLAGAAFARTLSAHPQYPGSAPRCVFTVYHRHSRETRVVLLTDSAMKCPRYLIER